MLCRGVGARSATIGHTAQAGRHGGRGAVRAVGAQEYGARVPGAAQRHEHQPRDATGPRVLACTQGQPAPHTIPSMQRRQSKEASQHALPSCFKGCGAECPSSPARRRRGSGCPSARSRVARPSRQSLIARRMLRATQLPGWDASLTKQTL